MEKLERRESYQRMQTHHCGGAEEKYRMTLAAWDAMVEVERPAQGYDEDCYWTFETGYPDSDTELDGARKVRA